MDASDRAPSVRREHLMSSKLLVVDDDETTRNLLREVFAKDGYDVSLAASGEEALKLLRADRFPLVVSDIRMLELDGLAVLREAKRAHPTCAVILMTGFGSFEGAIEAVQKGAFDYVSKPFQIQDIKAVVSRALRQSEAEEQERKRSARGRGTERVPFEDVAARGLIGRSARMVEVYKMLARSALSPSTVLVVGESGTGKELVARAIHDHSPRRDQKFIAVNCGALAENLLESELFGHVRGAFTGAVGDKRGLFEEAAGGTLFLDEIGRVSRPPGQIATSASRKRDQARRFV